MIKFGIDWSYFDLNFSKYTDEWGFFNGDAEYDGGMGGNYWYPDMEGYGMEPEDAVSGRNWHGNWCVGDSKSLRPHKG